MSSPKRLVEVGAVGLGANNLCSIQSMTNTDTHDVVATLAQIQKLADAGCEIVRVAVVRDTALEAFGEITAASPLPVVADIHFDHNLAIECARRGAAKLRINPGNIGNFDNVNRVIDAAGEAGIPIRIGVNAGSLAEEYHDLDMELSEKLALSALSFAQHFEMRGFSNIVLSAKASSVRATIDAYRLLDARSDYPLHIGVTEAGTEFSGSIKSAVGLGCLLEAGIGNTMRVSLTADPVKEIEVAWQILAALDIRRNQPELISCPTCGRCQVDMIPIANEVQARLKNAPSNLKVAVMGCVVNGPGEAREADFGIACGKGSAMIFAKGEPLRKVSAEQVVDELFREIDGNK